MCANLPGKGISERGPTVLSFCARPVGRRNNNKSFILLAFSLYHDLVTLREWKSSWTWMPLGVNEGRRRDPPPSPTLKLQQYPKSRLELKVGKQE